jgi:hypothetical protein
MPCRRTSSRKKDIVDEPNDEQPIPEIALTPEEMEERIRRLKAEGLMPNLGEFLQAIVAGRDEYVRSLKEEGAIPPDYEPSGIIDELQKLLTPGTDVRKPISIGDYERVRDALREIIGPGSWRAAIRIAREQDAVVQIRTVQTNLQPASEDEYDITVRDEGTIVVFTPHTEAGRTFLHEMLYSETWQWLGEALCLDHHMARSVIDGAENERLRIGSSTD